MNTELTDSARPRNYADIKKLAKTTGRKIPDLLALACTNDPYYVMPAQAKHGEWFAALWQRFDLPRGVHLRRIHYQLVSQAEPALMVDGRPYQNTELCWTYLGNASKAARCLSLVDAEDFADKRNPDAVLSRIYESSLPPWIDLNVADWPIPEIAADLAERLEWPFPEVDVGGYLAGDVDQPFHLELISEKSTVDDVVVPLCKSLKINYAPATGFQSITGVVGLLQRLRQAIKAEFAAMSVELPDRPKSRLTLPERFGGLFDSRRDYLTQIEFYKAAPAQGEAAP